MSVEQEGGLGGELWLFWTLCRWLLSQSIHCDFCFLWIIKNQSKSASLNIKPNSNPDFVGVCLLIVAVMGCLGFHVLTVTLKHLTWFHNVDWLCQEINKKWALNYFLTMGKPCVLYVWPVRGCFHLILVSSKKWPSFFSGDTSCISVIQQVSFKV